MSTDWLASGSFEGLEKMWQRVDWEEAESRKDRYQRKIALAAMTGGGAMVREAQNAMVGDLQVRCLAVRHVARSGSGPGVDGVRWRYDAQMMRAALALCADEFEPKPRRLVKMRSRNTGKVRSCGLLCWQDRAMDKLWAWALLPVAEAHADKKSFAFRPGRGPIDAHQCAAEMFAGAKTPALAVIVDLKCYYEHICHDWLLRRIPMDKAILGKLLGAGTVYAGGLFPDDGKGISEGSALSPIMGNMVLDGLQTHVYNALNGMGKVSDYANGNMVRFADDVLFAARTRDDAEAILTAVRAFAFKRGLALNEAKTRVVTVEEGFDFLSKTFKRADGLISVVPSEAAIHRFELELSDLISTWRRGQRELIVRLNRMLKGWAAFHRFGNSERAFRRVDTAVNAFLIDAALQRTKNATLKSVMNRYWCRLDSGAPVYAMPNDKTIHVARIASVPCIRQRKVRVSANAFLDDEYFEERLQSRAAANMSGTYGAVWERQGGRCHYCGLPILRDEGRRVVSDDPTKELKPSNAAYVHTRCAELGVEERLCSEPEIGRYELASTLARLDDLMRGVGKRINKGWRYEPVLRFFEKCPKSTVTLSVDYVEGLTIGGRLPAAARNSRAWWRSSPGKNLAPADAWEMAGFKADPDLEKGAVRFTRFDIDDGAPVKGHVTLPPQLQAVGIPDDAVYECEQFFAYIVEKYRLR